MGFGNTMYGISGYVWVTGSSRPIFVKQEKVSDIEGNVHSVIADTLAIFNQYQNGSLKEKTITICNTVFKLEDIQAIQLSLYNQNAPSEKARSKEDSYWDIG